MGTESPGSVRVNLSLPAELDGVLSELASITGRAKAAYGVEALTWYLPRLRALLAELKDGPPTTGGMVAQVASGNAVAVAEPLPVSRAERRRLEREQRKALKRGGGL